MRIASIERELGHNVAAIPITSHRSLLDFDVVIFDLEGLKEDLARKIADNQRRANQVDELLALGRDVFLMLSDYPLEWFLNNHVKRVEATKLIGDRMEFKGPSELLKFWTTIQPLVHYRAHLNIPVGRPFAYIEATKKVVGSWLQVGSGNLFIIPRFNQFQPSTVRESEAQNTFLSAIRELLTQLHATKDTVVLPEWTVQYGWPDEIRLRAELETLQQRLAEIERATMASLESLEVEERLKRLFSTKGDPLVEEVITAFDELGIKAESGPPGRDDIVAQFEGLHAVIEVKGKKGSAAEADAAQLEKWVATYKEDKGIDAKGILIVNAFAETPLNLRSEPAFPNQMLKYSTQREHCLLTSTQLLGLLLASRKDPTKKKNLVMKLFDTVGVMKEFTDHRTFIEFTEKK